MDLTIRKDAAVGLLIVLVAVIAPGSAIADRFLHIGGGWQTYANDRHGTEVEFPAHLFMADPPPADGASRRFASHDATLEVAGWANNNDETVGALKRRLLQSPRYEEVSYSPSGRDWLVLSGYRGDDIFYEKYLVRDGRVHAFAIQFPASAKPEYAPAIERMEDSFRVGQAAFVELTPAPPAPSPAPARSLPPHVPTSVNSETSGPSPMRDRLHLAAPATDGAGGDPLVVY